MHPHGSLKATISHLKISVVSVDCKNVLLELSVSITLVKEGILRESFSECSLDLLS